MEPAPNQNLRPLAAGAGFNRIALAATMLETHGARFRRTARRFSICDDDADDALQRATEILMTRAPRPDGRNLVAWMHVVVRHEALAVARDRRRQLSADRRGTSGTPEPFEPDQLAAPGGGPQQALEARERAARAARALRGLKPQERRAIALQAAGCSYAEIQAITGWTYTKVNRCLAEGRAALRGRAPHIDAA